MVLSERLVSVRLRAIPCAPQTARVREAMSHEIDSCFADEDAERVMRKLGEQQVRRHPAMSRVNRGVCLRLHRRLLGRLEAAQHFRRRLLVDLALGDDDDLALLFFGVLLHRLLEQGEKIGLLLVVGLDDFRQ